MSLPLMSSGPFVRIPAQRDRPFQQYDRSFQIDRDR
jgi:hypothetical protein